MSNLVNNNNDLQQILNILKVSRPGINIERILEEEPDIIPGNIRQGVDIFGVVGTFEGGANTDEYEDVTTETSQMKRKMNFLETGVEVLEMTTTAKENGTELEWEKVMGFNSSGTISNLEYDSIYKFGNYYFRPETITLTDNSISRTIPLNWEFIAENGGIWHSNSNDSGNGDLYLSPDANNETNRIVLYKLKQEKRYEFPTGEAGFYRHGTNFTELLCTWDDYIANGVTIDGEHHEGGITHNSPNSLTFSVPADVIIPEGYKYEFMAPYAGNVVVPADASDFYWTDYGHMYSNSNIKVTIIYIKATTPPSLSSLVSTCLPYLSKIVVPKGCADIYKSATGWCDYAEIIVEEGEVQKEVYSFPIGTAGFYSHDTNFTELLCTWDEYIANGVDIDGQHYEGGINNGYLTFTIPADIIIQEGYENLMGVGCGNIVIPSDVGYADVYDYSYMYPDNYVKLTTIYIKATTPPSLTSNLSDYWSNLTKIVVPKGCADVYKSATGWCDYAEIIVEEGDIIEEVEDEGQTALAGAYTPDGTFSNRVYTWDEMIERDLQEEYDGSYSSNGVVTSNSYDIVVPDTVTELYSLECSHNIVLPATITSISYFDATGKKLYIKTTTPPTLTDEGLSNSTFENIIVPIGCGEAYKNETIWCNAADIIIEGEMPI